MTGGERSTASSALLWTVFSSTFLSLLYAESKNYFNLLPPGYSLKTVTVQAASDQNILEKVLGGQFEFGVCDPATVFEVSNHKNSPAQLCALVANATFWAVDRLHKVFDDYQEIGKYYDTIISYHKGTSSHAIAQRVAKESKSSGDELAVMIVNPLQEWTALKNNPKAIALTPDILKASRFDQTKEYSIQYSFTNSPEYYNTLLSCLTTRQDVAQNHTNFIELLVTSIQIATCLVLARNDDVLIFAKESWSEDESYVSAALDLALKDKSFPDSIEIKRAAWIQAAELAQSSRGATLDKQVAGLKFDNFVAPFSHLAGAAFTKISNEGIKRTIANRTSKRNACSRWLKTNTLDILLLTISILPANIYLYLF